MILKCDEYNILNKFEVPHTICLCEPSWPNRHLTHSQIVAQFFQLLNGSAFEKPLLTQLESRATTLHLNDRCCQYSIKDLTETKIICKSAFVSSHYSLGQGISKDHHGWFSVWGCHLDRLSADTSGKIYAAARALFLDFMWRLYTREYRG